LVFDPNPALVGYVAVLMASGVRLATPLILTALGEIITERSGVLNLSLEGIMSMGALIGYITVLATGDYLLSMLAAALIGVLFGLLMSILSITLHADQGIAGLALFFVGLGLSFFLFRLLFGAAHIPLPVAPLQVIEIPLLSAIPIIGEIFFRHNIVTYLAFLSIPATYYILFKTPIGLKIIACGENPRVADSLGINVAKVRYICTMIGSMAAGFGGAYLALELGFFWEGFTAGRGWIAIALVVFSSWNPIRLFAGALIFGITDAIQLGAQAQGVPIPIDILRMTPYVATVLALVIMSKRGSVPTALATPYKRE